jgi:transposase-like protein
MVKGQWKYFYRAVHKQVNTINFLLTAKRDKKAALRFLTKKIARYGNPGLIDIDKNGANTVATQDYNYGDQKRIKIRQCKYLNNIVEQDHRRIKRQSRPMLGFKRFRSAQVTLAGIELIHMIKKGQVYATRGDRLSPAEQFYGLAA